MENLGYTPYNLIPESVQNRKDGVVIIVAILACIVLPMIVGSFQSERVKLVESNTELTQQVKDFKDENARLQKLIHDRTIATAVVTGG